MTVKPTKDLRLAFLARIHIAQKKLWPKDKDGYRDVLWASFGVESAACLDLQSLQELAGMLERRSSARRPACPPQKQHLIKKILAVLLNTPGVRKPGQDVLEYADATASEMFYRGQNVVVRVEMLDDGQLRKLIQALEVHKKRREGDQ